MQLTREHGIPLYVQVRERLWGDIAAMDPGEAIPTEAELEARFGVSRITIRRAIESLVSQGYLLRRQGLGTFVQRPKLTHDLKMIISWTEQIAALGYIPSTSQRSAEQVPPPRKIGHLLRLAEGEEVIKIRRVRLANNEPISLMYNYLPCRIVPEFLAEPFNSESLYELLRERYGLVAATAEDTVEARSALEDEAEALQIEPWSAALCVTRVSYLPDGTPLEVATAVSRGNRFQYRVTLHGQVRQEKPASPGTIPRVEGRSR